MSSETAEILAAALEDEADSHDRGEVQAIGARYDDTLNELLPIQDLSDPVFALAFEFWDCWVDASNHEWQYHKPLLRDDWPRLAREVADALRSDTLPTDDSELSQFLPRPREGLLKRLRMLLFGRESA